MRGWFRDAPDVLVRGAWYFSPKGADFLPFPTVFTSSVWDLDESDDFPIGERGGRGRYSKGLPNPRLNGRLWCGAPDLWLNGGFVGERGSAGYDLDGLPRCCVTDAGPVGGLALSGRGRSVAALGAAPGVGGSIGGLAGRLGHFGGPGGSRDGSEAAFGVSCPFQFATGGALSAGPSWGVHTGIRRGTGGALEGLAGSQYFPSIATGGSVEGSSGKSGAEFEIGQGGSTGGNTGTEPFPFVVQLATGGSSGGGDGTGTAGPVSGFAAGGSAGGRHGLGLEDVRGTGGSQDGTTGGADAIPVHSTGGGVGGDSGT